MKKSTIRTEKRPKKFRFFGRTQYCLTNTRLSGVLFFVQNKKNDCKTLPFVYIIKTECGIPRCSQQTEEEHRMNEKNSPLFTRWKIGNAESKNRIVQLLPARDRKRLAQRRLLPLRMRGTASSQGGDRLIMPKGLIIKIIHKEIAV